MAYKNLNFLHFDHQSVNFKACPLIANSNYYNYSFSKILYSTYPSKILLKAEAPSPSIYSYFVGKYLKASGGIRGNSYYE